MSIREDMPLLWRTLGQWKGTYTWVDAEGKITDKHRSHLTCEVIERDGEEHYNQVNVYDWPDGRHEEILFPADCVDKRLQWDTERIKGSCWEVDEETMILTWVRKDDPSGYFYEIINVSRDGQHKNRVWQFFEGGEVTRRTLINETRVAWAPQHDKD
ncbi:MAG: DUF3598 family protein [Trebonia sp.]